MITLRREIWVGRSLLLIAMAMTVLPFLSMLSTALAPKGSAPVGITWPSNPQFSNFVDAFNASNFLTLLGSSLFIAVIVVPATLILASAAGFALGPLRVPGSGVVVVLLLLGLTIPGESTIVPLYYQIRDLGLLNSQWAIILAMVGGGMPFSVYWMRTHFLSVPPELTEAARIDGASAWSLFWHVHLPLAVPSLSSMGLLSFLGSMNAFLLPVVLVDDASKRTLAGALGAFQSRYGTDTVLLNAGALLIILPSLIMFVIFQKQFIRGLLQGSGK